MNYLSKAKNKIKQHEELVKKYSLVNNFLSIANVILVGFAGISNKLIDENSIIFNVVFSGILYGSLVVTGIQKFYNYDQLIEKHRVSSLLYSVLCQNIEDEMIPIQYIRSQYQFLKALEPHVEIIPDYNEEMVVTPRDVVLDFEMSRLDNDS